MNTTDTRIQTSFRLRGSLLAALRKDAERNHRSLNNYVELILSNSTDRKFNADTLEAMYEIEHDSEKLETLDMKNFYKFVDSL